MSHDRPALRVHARHALRLGRSISANGDYIFRPGTHPTSDVNTAPTVYAPTLLLSVPSLLIALARTSLSCLRARSEYDTLTMIVMVSALSRNYPAPFSQIFSFLLFFAWKTSRHYSLLFTPPSDIEWFPLMPNHAAPNHSPTFANSSDSGLEKSYFFFYRF